MELQFIDEEITAFGGLGILKKMLDMLRFEQVRDRLLLLKQRARRGLPLYNKQEIVLLSKRLSTFSDEPE